MAGEEQDAVWPLPKFCFSVDFGARATDIPFQEVTGLETEAEVLEYRAGNSKMFSEIKMPGLAKTGSVTLKKGVFARGNSFFDWYSKIRLNTIERESVTIKLLDETGKPTMVWTLRNAWVTKITGPDLKSNSNDVAVETVELTHEGFTVENG